MLRRLILSASVALLVTGCDSAGSQRVEETRSRLVGTWLREGDAGERNARRVLALGADGQFTERVVVAGADAQSGSKEYAGEWSYDGIHLKRRFMREDGRQYSGGGIRFATFPLVSVGPNEFVVNDTIAKVQARYRRTTPGTQP